MILLFFFRCSIIFKVITLVIILYCISLGGTILETKIILIRHGQSLGNAQKIYLGHTDLDLSDVGREQAHAAAEYFKDEEISAIYSSDLLRAYNTALAHA